MIPLTVAAASSIDVKSRSRVADARRVGLEAHRDPGGDAHRSFAADEAPPQVEAGRVRLEAAEPGDRAVGEHDVERQDVRRGDPGGEAVGPAGVGGDVAADRAGLLRRRVGRVVEAEVRDRTAEVEVEDARLDPGDPRLDVDLQHTVHLGGHDDQRVVDGRRAARQPGAAAAGHERPAVPDRATAPRTRRRRWSAGSTPRRLAPARCPRRGRTTRAPAARAAPGRRRVHVRGRRRAPESW